LVAWQRLNGDVIIVLGAVTFAVEQSTIALSGKVAWAVRSLSLG
jgi:hypothetical protein